MVSKAYLNRFRASPQKVRLVANLIRGRYVEEALSILQFTPKGCSRDLAKLLKSAVANADQKGGVDVDSLYVSRITVDSGPTMKRHRPRAMGRATPILKRTSNIMIELAEG